MHEWKRTSMNDRRWISGAGVVGMALGALVFAIPAMWAQTYTVLYSFTGGADGGYPNGVTRNPAGILYGTTISGGTCFSFTSGCGVVFKLDGIGNETVLHTFAGLYADGVNPLGNLLSDPAGFLYGMTVQGGACSTLVPNGCGVVFRLDSTGEAVVDNFGGAYGQTPYGSLTRDAAANLYGTTSAGGMTQEHCYTSSCGVVFKLDPGGRETILYSFKGGADGGNPMAGVVRDSVGNLYGTTEGAGSTALECFPAGCGVVFKIDSTGHETVLHSFTGSPDGMNPLTPLVLDLSGNLYGTAPYGGANGYGAVFKVDPAGNEIVLYNFTGGADGIIPYTGLVLDPAGNLYGTTSVGGAGGAGTIFKLDPAGTLTVLHSFTGGTDGGTPSGLIRDPAGNFFGTTTYGGASGGALGYGVVFKLKP